MALLRNKPAPPEDVCLSIDVGSQNAGLTLFDGATQKVLWWRRRPLLGEHETSISDTKPVVAALQDIHDTVCGHLRNRKFWVLIERQHLDKESKRKVNPLLFNSQLEMICSTFFIVQGCTVKTIEPSVRYAFLGIHKWSKLTRHFRKVAVVKAVEDVLHKAPGNLFADRNHDLSHWNKLGGSAIRRSDLADSLAQALCFYYRNLGNLYSGNVVTSKTTLELADNVVPRVVAPQQKKQKLVPAPKSVEVRAALEKLITKLQISHYELLRGKNTDAAKLHAAHVFDPELTREFFSMLDRYNTKGIEPSNGLTTRLTHLRQH